MMTGYDLVIALRQDPQHTPQDWDSLNGDNWDCLLRRQPQFAKYCDWEKLDRIDWRWLLCKQPQFAEHCDFSKFTGDDWVELIVEQPAFIDKCYWDVWYLDNFETLRCYRPNIFDHMSAGEQRRAVALNKYVLRHIKEPSKELIRIYRLIHEL